MKAEDHHDGQLGSEVLRDVFKGEVRAWAQRVGVQPKEIHLRLMTKKWGSCSTNGRLTFNSRLLTQPAALRREVILHEVLHLKVPNEGKLFKTLLRSYLGHAPRM